jgi:aspartyl-tRNA(Asn)/glutamyl-tRNA(Gln) amidotransferase subunit A
MNDPVSVTEAALARIDACDDRAIFTTITRDRAVAEARAAAGRLGAKRPLGLLDGVPVAWKDLFDVQGLPTTAGSQQRAGGPPAEHDAAVVANLSAAGMICIGRTNMTEFAYSGIGLNPHFGTPRNPYGTEPRVPGGSSSGSAVAVARGLVPVAIGTDTGGSVRVPAALNGVVGYKATAGRYLMAGVFPLSPTLDSLGVLSRSVADATLVDAAMRRAKPAQPRPHVPNGVRIFVPTNFVLGDCEPAVLANFDAAIERLTHAGAVVERGVLPAFDAIARLGDKRGAIVAAEACAIHEALLKSDKIAGVDRRVVARLRAGAAVTLTDYLAVTFARRQLIADTAQRFAQYFIAFPTTPIVAPPIAALENDDERFFAANARILRNTAPGNFLDWCGVSLPNGRDAAGMPTALLLSAMPGRDDALLSLALGCEALIANE